MGHKDESLGDPASLRKRAEATSRAGEPPSPESLSPEEARRTLQELWVHQIELQMQNEELRRAQVELDAARARYFDLYELAPAGYVTISESGLILEANLTAARLLGVERGLLLKRRLASFIFHQDEDIFYLQRKRLLETGLQEVVEVRMVRPDGSQFWARLETTKAQSADGAQVFRVVISDITKGKRADEELQRSNAVLAGINTIFEEGLHCRTEEELGQHCLRLAKQITGSSLGFIGTIGPDGVFHDYAMSDSGWERCIRCDQDGHSLSTCSFKIHQRYGRMLQDGKGVFTNAPAGCPEGMSTPAGFQDLLSFMGVPLVEGGRTVGMIGLGNREGGYQQRELDSLETLAQAATEALHRKRAEAALRRSEEQLDTIYQDAPLMMLLVDGGGRIRKANRFAQQVTRVPEADMLGRCGGDAMRCLNALEDPRGCGFGPHCQTCTLRRTVLDTMATGNNHLQVEASLPLAAAGKGRELAFMLSTAAFNFQGEAQVLVTIQDISEHKRAEEALRQLSAIVESSDDAIIGKTLAGVITSWNLGAARLYGYSAAEMVGQPVSVLIPADHPDDEPEILRRIANGDRIEQYETFRRRKDGSLVGVVMKASPIFDVSGNIVGASTITRDNTGRKRAEEALIRSEKLASVSRMAASIAHEINNPLAAVANTIYLARTSADLPNSLRPYLETADDELKRITHITRQALGFYRESTAPAMVSVHSVLDSVMDLLRGKIKLKRAHIQKQCDGDLQVRAVAGELRQVLSNLLVNSLDAIAEGGAIALRASKSACADRGRPCIRITVADNGAGIDAATLPHIFEPLFTTKGSTGSGLGLWVSKQIVEKHHGRIRVRSSTQGKRRGTALSILLPAGGAPGE
jgi:PAS domain S-box-containing protein